MAGSLRIEVQESDRSVYVHAFSGIVELGRQTDSHEEIYSQRQLIPGYWRAVIARLDEDTLSRKHLKLEPIGESLVRVTNLSTKVPVRTPEGGELPAASTRDLPLPVTLLVGRKTVRVEGREGGHKTFLRSLAAGSVVPVMASVAASRFPTLASTDNIEIEELLRWLGETINVLQSAASSSDFFQKAARAVVDIAELDTGRVLLREKDSWKAAAEHSGNGVQPNPAWQPSQNVLRSVLREKKTFWEAPDQTDSDLTASLIGVEVVVAAPILDRAGEVIGVVYGDCRQEGKPSSRKGISKLEAMLVQLLAGGVATGLARIEQEKAALNAEVRFGQFFTPELARQLTLEPDLLKGRDSEVSILFCDIRGFSRISERLGPAGTVEWVGDVMGALSDCVLAHRGVLVDYIGDELMAMWGAPEIQEDHARLACRAALDMQSLLPTLNERWQARLGEPMGLGIGVNTGRARVGNTGSRHKFKYGPLGPMVNLASRVQGATKYLRTRLLITESTQSLLGDEFWTRRLCKVRVVNIATPVNLYELAGHGDTDWRSIQPLYEHALEDFERGNFSGAARTLGNLMAEHADDGPSLVLMGRAINALVAPDTGAFDPVWELTGK
jgi:adenylate cyclase